MPAVLTPSNTLSAKAYAQRMGILYLAIAVLGGFGIAYVPNGNAQVFLRPEVTPEGGLLLVSQGRHFGDAGFYFTVRRGRGRLAANYIRGMHETIHVYMHTDGHLRTDHILKLWGRTFLHLHYKMQGKTD